VGIWCDGGVLLRLFQDDPVTRAPSFTSTHIFPIFSEIGRPRGQKEYRDIGLPSSASACTLEACQCFSKIKPDMSINLKSSTRFMCTALLVVSGREGVV